MDITLPWPPSANRYWRNVGGHTLVSKEAREYKKKLANISLRDDWASNKFTGKISVHIIAFPPDRRRRDLDNLLKITLDSMQSAGLYDDDSQIDEIIIQREQVHPNCAELRVTIKEIPNA